MYIPQIKDYKARDLIDCAVTQICDWLWTSSSLIRLLACRLFDPNSLTALILTYFESNFIQFSINFVAKVPIESFYRNLTNEINWKLDKVFEIPCTKRRLNIYFAKSRPFSQCGLNIWNRASIFHNGSLGFMFGSTLIAYWLCSRLRSQWNMFALFDTVLVNSNIFTTIHIFCVIFLNFAVWNIASKENSHCK